MKQDNNYMMGRTMRFIWFLFWYAGILASLMAGRAYAGGFATNFDASAITKAWDQSNLGYCPYGQCPSNIGNGDPTPFGEDLVTIGGTLYYYTLVGDPAAGFAQEAYVRAGPAGLQGTSSPIISGSGGGFGLDGGGNLTSVIGNLTGGPTASNYLQQSLNSANPLGDYRVSGTGGNAPDYTVFRMVLTSPSGDMAMQVYKPFLDKKPVISQTVQDGSVSSTFVADESGLTYRQSGTAAPVINTLTVSDPSIPGGSGAAGFSMDQSQQSVVTAGRFTFDRPANYGWNDPSQGWNSTNSTFVFGTYNYVDGEGFQPLTYDWSQVFDYSQNAIACSAPAAGGFTRDTAGTYGGSCFHKP